MTKNEILDKVSMATCDHTDFDGIYKAMDEYAKQEVINHIKGGPDALNKAVEEYAKQQAKEFAKWTAINLWSVHGDNWYPYMDEDNPISDSELYELFIESKNK
jgi:5,10-methenyltetrahydromethanopterin hydrogenase